MFQIEKALKELEITVEELLAIRELAREDLLEKHGYFPEKTEGCCEFATKRLARKLKGLIIEGWFITDFRIHHKEMERQTKYGVQRICDISGHRGNKASHCWFETEKWLIDLTAEQFNIWLREPMKEIEIIPKNSKKARRYEKERVQKIRDNL